MGRCGKSYVGMLIFLTKLPLKSPLCGPEQPAGRGSRCCAGTGEVQAGRGRAAVGQKTTGSSRPPGGENGDAVKPTEQSQSSAGWLWRPWLWRAPHCSCPTAVILTH
ncbi:hypothetical protein SRHO_G00110360 [Serrasalmus rhombeus]